MQHPIYRPENVFKYIIPREDIKTSTELLMLLQYFQREAFEAVDRFVRGINSVNREFTMVGNVNNEVMLLNIGHLCSRAITDRNFELMFPIYSTLLKRGFNMTSIDNNGHNILHFVLGNHKLNEANRFQLLTLISNLCSEEDLRMMFLQYSTNGFLFDIVKSRKLMTIEPLNYRWFETLFLRIV